MALPKIKLAVLGRLPPDFDPVDLVKWSSSIANSGDSLLNRPIMATHTHTSKLSNPHSTT